MTPLCHAVDCNIRIPRGFLMCPRHWYMVPQSLRKEVWREHRLGQEETGAYTQQWVDVARKAINYVAQLEQKPPVPETADLIKTLEKLIAQNKGDKDG